MDGYCLRTRLLEKPSVCLYYKEVENDKSIPFALNVVVVFSPADALIMDKETADLLCKQLNEDRASLLAHGYTAFEIIPLNIANTKDNH